jgi:predicted acyltransferase
MVGSPRQRLSSVDALRGLTVAAMLLVNDAGDWSHVHPWLEHAQWHGCTLADFVFPFFLFIVGVSISLSVTPQLEAGADRAQLARKVAWRGLRIVLLGLALSAVAGWAFGAGRAFRAMGVLQRIGVCFALGGLAALYAPRARAQWLLFAAILLGYAALLAVGGPLMPGQNIVDRIDSAVLGAHAYLYDAASGQGRDPEGLLSTLPAIATVILGMRAGAWLRAGSVRRIAGAGVLAAALGLACSQVLPLNKQLWTPSFVLWTGGLALLALALAHELVDRRGWPALGRSMGVNAIAAYAGSWLAVCALEGSGAMTPLYRALFAEPLVRLDPWVPSLAFAAAFTALWWLLMAALYRRGWRLTI